MRRKLASTSAKAKAKAKAKEGKAKAHHISSMNYSGKRLSKRRGSCKNQAASGFEAGAYLAKIEQQVAFKVAWVLPKLSGERLRRAALKAASCFDERL